MTRRIAVPIALLVALPLAACASSRAVESAPASDTPSAQADEPQWEPWPPPQEARPSAADPAGSNETIRLLPKEGGWRLTEWIEQIAKATGRPILYDETNATFRQAKIDFTGTVTMRQSDLFAFAQAALSYKKLVLVPVGPKLADGQQAWFVMDQADPNLKSRPLFLEESEVLDYADRDGLYVVTTLRLRDTVDAVRARNSLSPLSTATAGIGRVQDNGGRFLIVGDLAPVVAAMKRLLDRINAETPPSALRPAPARSENKSEK
jgi:hypothetical protein